MRLEYLLSGEIQGQKKGVKNNFTLVWPSFILNGEQQFLIEVIKVIFNQAKLLDDE